MASKEDSHDKPTEKSTSELVASAKLVAEAAQSSLKNESDKVEKAKVAHAAGDLLDAAERYGKLDDKQGIGQYLDKAADYLHNYQDAQNTAATAPSSQPPPPESKGEESGSGGGLGGLANLAGGFFKK